MRNALILLPFLLAACPADDGDTASTTDAVTTTASTTDAVTTTASTTDARPESGSTAATAGTNAEGSTAADTTTDICGTCDPATEFCFASIFDGPTDYGCRAIPDTCTQDAFTCECVTPIVCPRSLQSCSFDGMLMVVECIEG